MTLVELLVVIVLLTTLVTTAIPIISPGGESRKLREASRNINAYLQGAQVRAMQTGRPFGVSLRRLSADTGNAEHNAVCVQLQYVEVPPAFSGVDNSSLVRVCLYQENPNDPSTQRLGLHFVRYGSQVPSGTDLMPAGYDADLLPDLFLRPGDTVEVGARRYVLEGPTQRDARTQERVLNGTRLRVPPIVAQARIGAGTIKISRTDNFLGYFLPIVADGIDPTSLRFSHDLDGDEITGQPTGTGPTLFATTPAPYKVYRQPVEAGGEPLELPAGVAIDLQASAFGDIRANPTVGRVYLPHADYNATDGAITNVRQDGVMILFAPEGNIHRVHGTQVIPRTVSSYLALCVGRRELIPALKPEGQTTTTAADYAQPIDLLDSNLQSLTESELREVTDKYNWLNLESRWVVIGGATGAITTVENSAVFPSEDLDRNGDDVLSVGEQIAAAIENAPRRTALGGR